jgi:polyribonucleotide nucleotidyltransferase
MQEATSAVATYSSLSEASFVIPCKKLVAECGEGYIEGINNLEKLTDILGQIDGQMEKIQIMQRFIVKALNDN